MRLSVNVLGLPTSILILLASQTNSVQAIDIDNHRLLALWPRDWIRVKDWIYASTSGKRDEGWEGSDVVVTKSPVGILKMSEDEGEKFYMEYWRFGDEDAHMSFDGRDKFPRERDWKEEARSLANSSVLISFRAPFALHTEDHSGLLDDEEIRARKKDSAVALAMLEKRDFKCPTGTSNCSSIGYPNSCCATDETCFQITDTGLGPVGCCPSGGNCGGTITNCASPNTPCAADVGGGCCIPNFVCASIGCVINPSLVVVVTTTNTFTVISSTPTTTIQITTITSTRSSSVSSTVSQSSTPISTTTSASGVVPVRPTGDSSTTTTTTSSAITQDTCPTGFYACSAHYQGGCCRTGRNCDTTSCPATSSTTIVSSGITVAVPVGSAATTTSATGACATGWTSCAASLGGDCCPSGWACGTLSCESVSVQATATTTEVLQKEVPGMGGRVRVRGSGGGVLGLGMLVGWLVL
ncbi:putative gpi anchored protein [Botrytis fragariae]|uniref:Putative gpi anchored protein n=1 Tax=Botrytis fragariae TaxID=1964551 RepID=A0A8H6AW86_9HELO|nr:putative gpi anchored protein [Botrytis fragariae]KAF5874871.1 putative gpi anchored protein [Botrytis fragariae]